MLSASAGAEQRLNLLAGKLFDELMPMKWLDRRGHFRRVPRHWRTQRERRHPWYSM
jgi:hypothetical protein